jgi:hypothetical protein
MFLYVYAKRLRSNIHRHQSGLLDHGSLCVTVNKRACSQRPLFGRIVRPYRPAVGTLTRRRSGSRAEPRRQPGWRSAVVLDLFALRWGAFREHESIPAGAGLLHLLRA